MSQAPALWTKHRPLALKLARDYQIPGLDHEDVRQEALIALWEASRTHDKARGANFPTWARRVINARLTDLLRTATREKRTAEIVLFDGERDGRAECAIIPSDLPSFTQLELEAMSAQILGSYDCKNRRLENASQAALRKLRAV